MMQRIMVRAPLLCIGAIIMTVSIQPRLAVVLVSMALALLGTVLWIMGRAFPLFGQAQQRQDAVNTTMQESLLAFVNAALKIRASGHACGFAGPLTYLAKFVGPVPVLLCAAVALPIVYWARLRAGRHSLRELVSGTIIGFAATQLVVLLYV